MCAVLEYLIGWWETHPEEYPKTPERFLETYTQTQKMLLDSSEEESDETEAH